LTSDLLSPTSLIFKILTIKTQLQKVFSSFTVAIFKTVMKFIALRGFDYVGEKTEVIAKGKQDIPVNPGFIFPVQV
jgi:hypothetical protein